VGAAATEKSEQVARTLDENRSWQEKTAALGLGRGLSGR
jgi:hypothetical protein